MKSAFNYFGGKHLYLKFILPILDTPHLNYVEPFCGSAAVFLNKRPSPIETLNDMDGRLINFFRVLREHPQELIKLLNYTPYSRAEFNFALPKSDDPIEDARRFFVRVMQSYAGQCDQSRRINSFRLSASMSRKGMGLDVSKWRSKIGNLHKIVDRLRQAQIDNRDCFFIIPKFNKPDTLLYCDPPYDHEARSGDSDYKHEFTEADHRRLAQILNSFKGKVAISGYDSEMYRVLYSGWNRHCSPLKANTLGKTKKNCEVIWTNYQVSNSKLF